MKKIKSWRDEKKLFKITNYEEIHNRLQYHDGLVEDPLPFNPSGSCIPGGIYFSGRDILGFCYYGDESWIREVTIPEGTRVVRDPEEGPVKYRAKRVILGSRKPLWNVETFEWLEKNGVDIHIDDDKALRYAASEGYLNIVKYLIERGSDVHAFNDKALRWAVFNGHLNIVKYLVEHGADVYVNNEEPLEIAEEHGHTDIVEYFKGDNGGK